MASYKINQNTLVGNTGVSLEKLVDDVSTHTQLFSDITYSETLGKQVGVPKMCVAAADSMEQALRNAGINDQYMIAWGNTVKANIASYRNSVVTVYTNGPIFDCVVSGNANNLWTCLLFQYAASNLIKISEVYGKYYVFYIGT